MSSTQRGKNLISRLTFQRGKPRFAVPFTHSLYCRQVVTHFDSSATLRLRAGSVIGASFVGT